ncbi:MAG: hypothetical protein HYR88_02455 [Verrucomicrobia bacterium]|nr:hypothetical protein [Verrucomicrobiota bacterium]
MRLIVAALVLAATAQFAVPAPALDDRAITLRTERDIAVRRQELIRHIWGPQGFPERRLPSVVKRNVPSPVRGLDKLARVDELRFDLAPGLEGLAYHFIPASPNRELVILHHGHACSLDDSPSPADPGYGLQHTIRALLLNGYGVLGVYMPRQRPGDCGGSHEALFSIPTQGSALKYFLEPVAFSLNHLKSRSGAADLPKYRAYHMAGLSGGGWTATVYAAIDPTIQLSFPIAGSIPLYLRSGGSIGDLEQFEPSFYRIAGYPDLYVLGAHGRNRAQVQILNRRDDCCFGEAEHDPRTTGLPYANAMRLYAQQVSEALSRIGSGTFRLEIDDTAPSHLISDHAIQDILLPELRRHAPSR